MTAKVPGVPQLQTKDTALARWAQAINTAIQALANAKLITQDDIDTLNRRAASVLTAQRESKGDDVTVDFGGGLSGSVAMTELVSKLTANQGFKNALSKLYGVDAAGTGTGSSLDDGVSQTDIDTLNSAISLVSQLAQEANQSATEAKKLAAGFAYASRGPIRAAGVWASWNDLVAARSIYWTAFNGGTGTAPAWPANADDFLVVGDVVTLRDTFTEPCSWFESKQWLGSGIGWVSMPSSIDFNDVINLGTMLTNLAAILTPSLQLVGSTVVAGTGRTLAQIASARAPITWAYGQVPFEAGGTTFPAAWNDSVASYCVLYQMYGNFPLWQYPMPTAWLVYGDRCRLYNPAGGYDETRQWTGSAWV